MGKRRKSRIPEGKNLYVTALVADAAGEIFELEGYAAVGMAGEILVPLTRAQTVPMPHGGELMFLPDRDPILFNLETGALEILADNPFQPGTPLYPVAAFNSPGYVVSYQSAFAEHSEAPVLPLFSYGAVGWLEDGFRTAVFRVDAEPRQDLRRMAPEAVRAGVARMQKRLPGNRLRAHLERCALEYGCPAGKNFFLGRYEAPLPTSTACNARCLGCLSLQPDDGIPCSQNRIDFTPSPVEIAAVALEHIRRVPGSVVSFGQGCEGDPLLAADAIEPAISRVREKTGAGTINMNTNGSRPEILARLLDAGLDSVRISLNSFRPACYGSYFRPRNYSFDDVLESIRMAIDRKRFVSINYLNMAGFTDTPEELDALCAVFDRMPIRMIQWRNLNFDPLRYRDTMKAFAGTGAPMGMKNLFNQVRKRYPDLHHGYFNPPKEKW